MHKLCHPNEGGHLWQLAARMLINNEYCVKISDTYLCPYWVIDLLKLRYMHSSISSLSSSRDGIRRGLNVGRRRSLVTTAPWRQRPVWSKARERCVLILPDRQLCGALPPLNRQRLNGSYGLDGLDGRSGVIHPKAPAPLGRRHPERLLELLAQRGGGSEADQFGDPLDGVSAHCAFRRS